MSFLYALLSILARPCRARACLIKWPHFFVVDLYSSTLYECSVLWMAPEGVELGTFLGRAVGSRRDSPHRLSRRGGCWELEDVVVNTTAAPPFSNSVGASGEAQDFYNWLWNLGGDVRMGVMGSVSLNCQVRSFCNDSPHLDDSPFLSLLFDLLS